MQSEQLSAYRISSGTGRDLATDTGIDLIRYDILQNPFSLRPLVIDHRDLPMDLPAPVPQREEPEQCSTQVTEEDELEQRPIPPVELPAPEATRVWKDLPSYLPSFELASKVRVCVRAYAFQFLRC